MTAKSRYVDMKPTRILALALGLAATALGHGAAAQAVPAEKPRVVVTTDPELDDTNSLIRFLLHANDFRIEGIVYSSSGVHWKGDGQGTMWYVAGREYTRGTVLCPCESWRWDWDDRFIDEVVDIYERVYPNLRVHDPDYPTPAELRSKVVWGNVDFDGNLVQETAGSELIERVLLDDQPGQVYLLAWGGQGTIARALRSIQEQYEGTPQWAAIREKVSRKAVISAWGDQDGLYAEYIRPNWPEIDNRSQRIGDVAVGYGTWSSASEENAVYFGSQWMRENVTSQGPFGAHYLVWADDHEPLHDTFFDQTDYFGYAEMTADELRARGFNVWTPPRPLGTFISEGDTPTFLNMVDNGLLGYLDRSWGGWGGRNAPAAANAAGQGGGGGFGGGGGGGQAPGRPASPNPNFYPAVQNEFAARLRWSVTPSFRGANHPPRVTVQGAQRISARPGETINLRGAATDPDGNRLSTRWWQFAEVDSYPGTVTLSTPTSLSTSFQVPADATAGQTIHLILEVSDNAVIPFTRYQRVIVTAS